MARRIDEFSPVQRGDGKYPWSDWTDGNIWELKRGDDFDSSLASMRQTCKKVADRRGLKLETRTRKDARHEFLQIQFVDPTNTQRRSGGARTRAT